MPVPEPLRAAAAAAPSAGIRALARFGFATIGVVYGLMGLLALLAATGQRGGSTGTKEQAVRRLQDLPGGAVLLGLMAFGLLGYVVWRFTQAIMDTESKGSGAKGLGRRLGYAGSGVFYAGLALYAGRLAVQGSAEEGGADASQSLTARVLAWPGGSWLVLAVGLVVIGIGVYQVIKAYAGQFEEDVNASGLSAGQQQLVHRAGQVGFTARGLVLGLIGFFFAQAGWQARAGAVGGTAEVFDLLARMGPLVLGVVAAGLMAYGLFMLVQARYPVLRGV